MTGRRRHPVDEREWASPEMGEVRLATRLELANAFGQEPQRPVQAQVLVDSLHRTGALMAAAGRASAQPPFDEVLLDAVEDGPLVALAVVPASRGQQLAFRDRRGLGRVVVLECEGGMRKYFRFALIEGDGAHRIARVLHALEAFEDFVSTFDHLACHVALVGHADVGGGVTADQAVVADEPEHAGQHLVAARAVVAVEQDDLVRLVAIDLAGMAKSDEMLGVFTPVFVAHARLAHHEGLEPLLAQLGQHGRGRYVGIPIGPAPMRGVGKDRWSNSTDAVIRERAIGTQDRGLRGKTGCQRHGCSPWRNATTARS